MTSEAVGEIETENGVLVIKRIHVIYHIRTSDRSPEVISRVHEIHKEYCPVYQSIKHSIEVTTDYQIEME